MVELIKYGILIGAILVALGSRRWALPTLAFFIPLMQWLPEIPVTGLNAMNLMLLPVLLRAMAAGSQPAPNQKSDPLVVPLIVFSLLFTASYVNTLMTDDLPRSFYANDRPFRAMVTLKEVLVDMALYFCARRLTRTPEDIRNVFGGVMAGYLFESFTAFREFVFGNAYRTTGHLGQPNKLGNFLAGYSMIPFGIALTSKGKLFWASGVGVMFGLLGLMGAISRGSLLAVGFGMLVLAVIRRSKWLIVLAFIAATAPTWLPDKFMDRFEDSLVTEEGQLEFDPEKEGRIHLWEAAGRMIADNPMGVGLEQFRYHLRGYGYEGRWLKSSHNIYIQLAAEQGILASLAHTWTMLAVGLMGWGLYRRSRDRLTGGFGLGVLGMVLAFLVATAFGDGFYENNLSGLFWILAGITVNLRAGFGKLAIAPDDAEVKE